MIRINLLGIKKEKAGTRMPSVSVEGAKATALFVVIALLAVGWIGFRYTTLTSENARLNEDLRKAQAEKQRLQAVKEQVDAFEKKKQLLTKKINIIETLKRNQTGPVTMLNALANTVQSSGTLWLTSFTNDGTKIAVNGIAGNVNTVADFITNLKRSSYFKNVEIAQSYEEETPGGGSTFVFTISADVAPPEAPPATGTPAAAAAPGSKS